MKRTTMLVDDTPFSVLLGDTFFLRLRGLIGRTMGAQEGFLLRPCSGIHTFFMAYSIDAVYLDGNMTVVRCDRNVPPRRLLRPARGAKQVLELPAGTVRTEQLTVVEVK